jgi:phospholipid/cholesterol/gamma-HCH transport system substrate-binding protein
LNRRGTALAKGAAVIDQKMRFRVGIFVLATLGLFAVLILVFSSSPLSLGRHQDYTVVFSNATGVGPGTPVRRSGVTIGAVKSVALDDDTGDVRVDIRVDSPHMIRRDEQPTLSHALLGGDAVIDFVPRPTGPMPPDRTPVEAGAELRGVPAPDAVTLLNRTSELLPTTQETLDQMRKSMQRFEQITPQAEEAMRELRDLSRSARETIPELRRTNEEFQNTSRTWTRLGDRMDKFVQTNQDRFGRVLDDFDETSRRLNTTFSDENQRNLTTTLKNTRAASERFDNVTRNFETLTQETRQTLRAFNDAAAQANVVLSDLDRAARPLADRGERMIKNLDESAAKLNQTIDDVREMIRAFLHSEGTIKKLLTDPALYDNLNAATCMIVRILPRLDYILKDIQVFADKIARHPESLGIRGAVAPGSGLKEGPSGWQRPP